MNRLKKCILLWQIVVRPEIHPTSYYLLHCPGNFVCVGQWTLALEEQYFHYFIAVNQSDHNKIFRVSFTTVLVYYQYQFVSLWTFTRLNLIIFTEFSSFFLFLWGQKVCPHRCAFLQEINVLCHKCFKIARCTQRMVSIIQAIVF